MLQVIDKSEEAVESVSAEDDRIVCATCDALITRGRWRIVQRGSHDHTVFNPAGLLFCVLCFSDAPGVFLSGSPNDNFTWFPGYHWQVAVCRSCGSHTGWGYLADGESVEFFGLIKAQIREA